MYRQLLERRACSQLRNQQLVSELNHSGVASIVLICHMNGRRCTIRERKKINNSQDCKLAGGPCKHEEEQDAYREADRSANVARRKYEHAVPSAHCTSQLALIAK